MRSMFVALCVCLAGGAVVAPAGAETQYVLGPCSRVILAACPECEDAGSEPLTGGFSLAPALDDLVLNDAATYVVRDLVFSSEHVEAHGSGVLLVDGHRASLLGMLTLDEEQFFFGGGGVITGPPPHTLHIDHIIVGDVRLEIYGTPAIYPDADGDGVTDPDDLCSATRCGDRVDAAGCAIDQYCPCGERLDGELWGSHRNYVRCVLAASRELLLDGRLNARSRSRVVKSAVQSQCGRSAIALLSYLGG